MGSSIMTVNNNMNNQNQQTIYNFNKNINFFDTTTLNNINGGNLNGSRQGSNSGGSHGSSKILFLLTNFC
jgi:hypothetical protein